MITSCIENGATPRENETEQIHRVIMWEKETKQWWVNHQLHRENGPAIEFSDGSEEWFFHGKRHRENGPAVAMTDGLTEWYYHGNLHRIGGPAVYVMGKYEHWHVHGKVHRRDLPAVISKNYKVNRWYLFGNIQSKESFINIVTQHYLKLLLLNTILPRSSPFRLELPPGSETLVDQYSL